MSYILMPSLEHIALVKIATALWNQDDIRDLIAKFYFPLIDCERREKWQEIEDKVIEKVLLLPQPGPLKKELLSSIKPIGLQILKWMEYHNENCYLAINLPVELCWTPHGTVDKKKTAELLIRDENLDIAKRYKLACIYCLTNDIPMLWNKISENRRRFFYSEEDPRGVNQRELVVLWTYDIKGELARMGNMIEKRWRKCTPYQYAFEYAAVGGNRVATEYFFQKLTAEEREESLVRSTGYVAIRRCDCASNRTDLLKEDYADVLCFLLSQMNEEQQVEVFERHPYKVLKCFLDWPWQNFFMETAKRTWAFLSEKDYDRLLRVIVNKVIDGYKDCDYRNLFKEFWQQSPVAHKEYVIGECANRSLVSKLLQIRDKENIKQILDDATTPEREKIIFSDKGKSICESLMYHDEIDLLKFFILECISYKDLMIKFKGEFRKRIIRRRSEETLEREKDMWNKFFQLLDDLIQKEYKKRSVEEGNNKPPKRLA